MPIANEARFARGEETHVLVIDIGAGHLDCALVVVEHGVFEVRWTGGCAYGGNDIDVHFASWCMEHEEFSSRKTVGWDDDKGMYSRVVAACEKAKRTLSISRTAIIDLPFDVKVTVTQEDLEADLSIEVLPRLTDELRKLLERGDGGRALHITEQRVVDQVVVLGDACRLPCVHKAVCEAVGAIGASVAPHPAGASAAALAHTAACGGALQGAILGDRCGEGGVAQTLPLGGNVAAINGMMLIDTCPYALGFSLDSKAKHEDVMWLVAAHTPIPMMKEVACRIVRQQSEATPPGATLHMWEDAGVSGVPGAWLGAVAVPWQGQDRVGFTSFERARIKVDMDQDGHLRLDLVLEGSRNPPPPQTPPPPGPPKGPQPPRPDELLPDVLAGRWSFLGEFERLDCLDASECVALTAELWGYADAPKQRYAGILSVPGWRPRAATRCPEWLARWQRVEDDDDDNNDAESSGGSGLYEDTDEDGEPVPRIAPPPHRGRRPPGVGGYADSRGKAQAERLRQKLQDRQRGRVAAFGASSSVASSKDGLGTGGQATVAASGLSSTDICAVCLCTEEELGRPFPFVLERCGHKCLCKPCLRKIKSRNKQVQVECPLCRVKSRPVLFEKYEGAVYTAEAD